MCIVIVGHNPLQQGCNMDPLLLVSLKDKEFEQWPKAPFMDCCMRLLVLHMQIENLAACCDAI